jgi:hypothetical protein
MAQDCRQLSLINKAKKGNFNRDRRIIKELGLQLAKDALAVQAATDSETGCSPIYQ